MTPAPRPTFKKPVRELVEEAGINVDDWAFTKDGEVIENPNDNIGRNTSWSFIGADHEPIALCIWYIDIDWASDPAAYHGNEHQYLQKLTDLAGTRKDGDGLSRLNAKMRQGRRLQQAVYEAFSKRREVRFILVDGDQVPIEESADRSSIVRARSLDHVSWFVHEYDGMSGDFVIVRGVPRPDHDEADPTAGMIDPAEDPVFLQMLDQLDATEREALIKARVGQGDFRSALINRWGGCSVTGCGATELLVASHIKPWSLCANRNERLSPANGLLLLPTLDKLLDRGFISFDDQFRIMLSPQLKPGHLSQLNITSHLRLTGRANRDMLPFLRWHRANLFRSN